MPKPHMVTYAVNEAPEPKVAYPDSCPRWKLNYQYPAWRFESKNDYGCQFNKLPLRRNFKVEMNRCSEFPKGQCTEWVDGRFFQLTGAHTMFNGDATDWDVLAREKPEWSVSTTPSVPSIIVMKNWLPNVEKEGHVGVVESINQDGSVCTSNWNFPTLMHIGMRNVKPGPGIFFIRYIGKPPYSSK
ncbi:hypothetical protein DSO57_1003655 [Entomophthora muscae]|uniref:Uncharacterized protein n=1 Tax=Entomophthora muscae TaxID=34485 RepID=A0ACC2T890_9FUNG|nr:hypothetical protein DSO57_1003655 [Entomophthora muscae]